MYIFSYMLTIQLLFLVKINKIQIKLTNALLTYIQLNIQALYNKIYQYKRNDFLSKIIQKEINFAKIINLNIF